MALPQEKTYTIDDILALPENVRAELIDGQIYYMAAPTPFHQMLSNLIASEFTVYIRKKKGTCKVYPAPFSVFLNANNTTYVQPDISIVCDVNKISKRGCEGAPDLVIEIVSPSSHDMDYFIKLFKYRTAGVREYWIVDPSKGRVTVYDFERSTTKEYTFSDTVKVNIFDDLEINFSELN